jgi:hypothetical protein
MSIQLSRANTGTPLTTADYNSDNLIVETAVNSLLGTSSSGGTVTNFTEVDTDVAELFSASVSNPTTTPEITFSRISKAANLVYASPDGTSGKPTMRALVSTDLPVVPFNKGGTGITTAMTDNKVLSQRSGTIKYTGITAAGTSRIVVTPTTDNFEIDIVPANIEINTLASTTPLSFAKGGTNSTSQQAAINSLTAVSGATNEFVLTKDTSTGNAIYKAQSTGIVTLNGLTGATVTIGADNILAGATNKWYTATEIAQMAANTAKVTNATHTGDVTGSGALTIAANAVTYAKMQAISATKRLLGRISGGAGSAEEIAISGNLAMSATDLIVRTSKIKTITANYSVPITEGTILVNGSSLTITLPDTATVANGDEFIIKNIAGATTNSLVVFNAGIEEIDGSATYTGLNLAYNCVTVKYGGSNRWYIMSKITTG